MVGTVTWSDQRSHVQANKSRSAGRRLELCTWLTMTSYSQLILRHLRIGLGIEVRSHPRESRSDRMKIPPQLMLGIRALVSQLDTV